MNGHRRLRRLTVVLGIFGTVLAAAAPARAQSVSNDRSDQRTPVAMGGVATSPYSNVFAGIDPGEPLTSNAQNGISRCDGNGRGTPDTGARMANTEWWQFTGTGGLVTVSTSASVPPFDTVLAVYDGARNPADAGALLGCNDDESGPKNAGPSATTSKLVVSTARNQPYAVQTGTCESTTTSPTGCVTGYGQIAVGVTPVPPTVSSPNPPVPGTPAKPRRFSFGYTGFLIQRYRGTRRTRIAAFGVRRGAPAGTKMTVRCRPRTHCPFRRPLRRTIGPKKYSIARLLGRYHHGRLKWKTTIDIVFTKRGYRPRLKRIVVYRSGLARPLESRDL